MSESVGESSSRPPMELSGAAPSSHPPVPPVDAEADLALGADPVTHTSPAPAPAPAPPVDTEEENPVTHTPPAPALRKVVTFPFYAIAGGMGVILGGLRLGAWVIRRVFSLLGLEQGRAHQPLLLTSSESGATQSALPSDLVLLIASRLGPPRRDVEAMRSTCPAWRRAIPNTNGPFLIMSRSPNQNAAEAKGTEQFVALRFAAGGDLRMDIISSICQPPADTVLWGAAHGFLALQQRDGPAEDLFFHCLNCGGLDRLPVLPEGMTASILRHAFRSGGLFSPDPSLLSVLAVFPSANGQEQPLYTETVDMEVGLLWGLYPGAEGLKSLGFAEGVHFVGVRDDMLVIGERGWPLEDHLVHLNLQFDTATDLQMLPWGNYGLHVFKCDGKIFVCGLFRSKCNELDVRAEVLVLESSSVLGYSLSRVDSIGDFAVFLGGNQAFVLPAVEGLYGQRANTIYIQDDDGISRKPQVLAISIGTGEVSVVQFPEGLSIDGYERTFWASPPPLNVQFWHCDTTLHP